MLSKALLIISALVLGLIAFPLSAYAHVTVKPAEVGQAARQTFNVSVPNESETAEVVKVRLIIPEGLKSVSPNAKPGWKVEVKKEGTGEASKVTEVIWTTDGSTIPVDLRDDFFFGAQAPADATELQWKAYETYSDGQVVAWDQAPKEGDENVKPYSVTKVVKDTEQKSAAHAGTDSAGHASSSDSRANIAIAFGILGLLAGGVALIRKPVQAKK